ncbi:MAG: DUF2155 domain-containing protein [Minwuia sp.]|uniref:DUF2155 domain-containing protein n=1 Tax=Minwuia sp. TaxID=2493630 RepID=UPI003A8AC553
MDRRLRQIALFGLLAGLSALPAAAQTAGGQLDYSKSGEVAILRALDKVTADHTDLEVPVGSTVRFGTLEITVDYCRSRPPQEQPESFVLLSVRDLSPERDIAVAFEGWMLASMPSLNPLEHPVYDLWAIDCRMPRPADEETQKADGNG